MNAYYTSNNGYDAIVIPATGVAFLGFSDEDVKTFLKGKNPDFGNWTGDNTCEIAETEEQEFEIAESFGTIIAQRLHRAAEARFLALGTKHNELLAMI
jgi:hypothetical protein